MIHNAICVCANLPFQSGVCGWMADDDYLEGGLFVCSSLIHVALLGLNAIDSTRNHVCVPPLSPS